MSARSLIRALPERRPDGKIDATGLGRTQTVTAQPKAALPPPHIAESHPVEILAGDPACGLVLICDHASNHVPADLGRLGVPETEYARHIAYDIGAAGVTRRLAAALGAPAVLTRFSRLIIDPNRGRDDPTLVMRLSDGAVVPGNARIDGEGVAERVRRFYDPFDRAIEATIGAAQGAGRPPAIVTIHSFTPFWRGVARPWQVGILYDRDDRLSVPLIAGLAADPAGLTVGDNEPYGGGLPGDTIDRHATARGLPNALVEIRQDLIAGEEGQAEWAARFARLLGPLVRPAT